MALVEISKVSLAERDSERLWGYHIELPKIGDTIDLYAITIAGWVLGRDSRIVAVEIMHQGQPIQTIPIRVRRPDVAMHYPGVPDAEHCGFRTVVGVLGMASEFELLLHAVLQDECRVPLAVIRGRHRPVSSTFQPALHPLMITSLGRTGTTWLMRLLAEHPCIVVYKRYPLELRTAQYWMHMLKILSMPANPFQSSNSNNFHANMWYVGHNPFYSEYIADHPQLENWFGRSYVEQLATFCQGGIEECYLHVASSQGQREPTYFAEKYIPNHIPWLIWELYPQAREIFLTRDFRDVLCSILAFNAKRGYVAFDRERFNSDKEYVQHLRHSSLDLLQSWQSRAAYAHLLRYEDLVLRPIETLQALLEYLALDSTSRTVEGMIQRASADTSELQEHKSSSDPKASIDRWKRELDTSMQAVCREAFGDILNEFGYGGE
jgi:Sulfotransferase family